jgi:hypothetical protein
VPREQVVPIVPIKASRKRDCSNKVVDNSLF